MFKDNTSPQAFPPCLLLSDDSDHQGSAIWNADQKDESKEASQGSALSTLTVDDAIAGLRKGSEIVSNMAEGMDIDASYSKGRCQIFKCRRRKQRKRGKVNKVRGNKMTEEERERSVKESKGIECRARVR